VVGVATNLVPDANSLLQYNFNVWGIPYPYQLRAFIWDQKNGMQDLHACKTISNAISLTLPGDFIFVAPAT
jgi:hypothetical protein